MITQEEATTLMNAEPLKPGELKEYLAARQRQQESEELRELKNSNRYNFTLPSNNYYNDKRTKQKHLHRSWANYEYYYDNHGGHDADDGNFRR